MKNLEDLEKFINSELTSKINKSFIKHDNIYLNIDHDELIDVVSFLKTNKETKFRQLIEITAVDYPGSEYRFKMVYLLLSHEYNKRVIIDYSLKENDIISSLTSLFNRLKKLFNFLVIQELYIIYYIINIIYYILYDYISRLF